MKEINEKTCKCFLSPEQIDVLFILAMGLCVDSPRITSQRLINLTYHQVYEEWYKIIDMRENDRFHYVKHLMKELFSQNSLEEDSTAAPFENAEDHPHPTSQSAWSAPAKKSVANPLTDLIISLHLQGLNWEQITAKIATMKQSESLCEEEKDIGDFHS